MGQRPDQCLEGAAGGALKRIAFMRGPWSCSWIASDRRRWLLTRSHFISDGMQVFKPPVERRRCSWYTPVTSHSDVRVSRLIEFLTLTFTDILSLRHYSVPSPGPASRSRGPSPAPAPGPGPGER